jgi:hypothetical protein
MIAYRLLQHQQSFRTWPNHRLAPASFLSRWVVAGFVTPTSA